MNLKPFLQEIEKQGYTVIENLLNENECEFYKNLLEEDYKKFSSHYAGATKHSNHSLDIKKGEKVVYNLHNKNIEWFKLFQNKTVLDILDATLLPGSYMNSEPYHLINISARSPLKNNNPQQLHLDSNLPGGDYPLIMIVLWMLDDFNESTGATRVIPGSHKFKTYAENNVTYDDEVTVNAKKGSVLIYNASLWHGGGINKTANSRWGLVLGYGRWFIKPSFDYIKNTPPDIFKQLDDDQKKLLGFYSCPPKDEFTRVKRRSDEYETPEFYSLPKTN